MRKIHAFNEKDCVSHAKAIFYGFSLNPIRKADNSVIIRIFFRQLIQHCQNGGQVDINIIEVNPKPSMFKKTSNFR